jgi:hypothetical protein
MIEEGVRQPTLVEDAMAPSFHSNAGVQEEREGMWPVGPLWRRGCGR